MREVDVGFVIPPSGRKNFSLVAFKVSFVDSIHDNCVETLKATIDAAVKMGHKNGIKRFTYNSGYLFSLNLWRNSDWFPKTVLH